MTASQTEMKAAHTPGPWTTRGHDIKADGGNILVGAVFHTLHEDKSADQNALANARLIAAAPDMLAALRDCVAFCRGHQERPEKVSRYRRVVAAIARAEGR